METVQENSQLLLAYDNGFKISSNIFCSIETTKSTGLVRKKTRIRGTRPQYLPLVCLAGGAQPHRGKFT